MNYQSEARYKIIIERYSQRIKPSIEDIEYLLNIIGRLEQNRFTTQTLIENLVNNLKSLKVIQ